MSGVLRGRWPSAKPLWRLATVSVAPNGQKSTNLHESAADRSVIFVFLHASQPGTSRHARRRKHVRFLPCRRVSGVLYVCQGVVTCSLCIPWPRQLLARWRPNPGPKSSSKAESSDPKKHHSEPRRIARSLKQAWIRSLFHLHDPTQVEERRLR